MCRKMKIKNRQNFIFKKEAPVGRAFLMKKNG